MKPFIVLISCIISFSSFGQQVPGTSPSDRVTLLVDKISSNTITENERKELKKLTYGIQNKGLMLDHIRSDYSNSLVKTDEALLIWIAMADTLNEANNRKFKGYLLGRLGRFPEAKREIDVAIKLFQIKNKKWGVAVSHFNLSRVYEYEHKLDSALYFADLAVNYWKTTTDTFRILGNSNQLFNLYYQSEQYVKAEEIQKECEMFPKIRTLNGTGLLDFYYLSHLLYGKMENAMLAEKYKKLYKDELKSSGSKRKSKFEELATHSK